MEDPTSAGRDRSRFPSSNKTGSKPAKTFAAVAPHLSDSALEMWRDPLEHLLGTSPRSCPELDDMFCELLDLLAGDLSPQEFGRSQGTRLDASHGTITRAAVALAAKALAQASEIAELHHTASRLERERDAARQLAQARHVELSTLLQRQTVDAANRGDEALKICIAGHPLRLDLRGGSVVANDDDRQEIARLTRLAVTRGQALLDIKALAETLDGRLSEEANDSLSRDAFEAVGKLARELDAERRRSESIAQHNAKLMLALAGIDGEEWSGGVEAPSGGVEAPWPGHAHWTSPISGARIQVLAPSRKSDRTVILTVERVEDDEASARTIELPIEVLLHLAEQGMTVREAADDDGEAVQG